jgi:hypothetical protein
LSILVQSADPKYSWVERHTWQSWRERYKKNSERLDKLITTIVENSQTTLGEKGQYNFVRARGEDEAPVIRRKKRRVESNPGDGEIQDGNLKVRENIPSTKPGKFACLVNFRPLLVGDMIAADVEDRTALDVFKPYLHLETDNAITADRGALSPFQPPPSNESSFQALSMTNMASIAQVAIAASATRHEEESSDDEDSTWAVRKGTDPVPAWSKYASEEQPGSPKPGRSE